MTSKCSLTGEFHIVSGGSTCLHCVNCVVFQDASMNADGTLLMTNNIMYHAVPTKDKLAFVALGKQK